MEEETELEHKFECYQGGIHQRATEGRGESKTKCKIMILATDINTLLFKIDGDFDSAQPSIESVRLTFIPPSSSSLPSISFPSYSSSSSLHLSPVTADESLRHEQTSSKKGGWGRKGKGVEPEGWRMEKGGPRPSLFSLYPPFRRRLFVPGGAEEKLTAWLFVRGHGKQKKPCLDDTKKGEDMLPPESKIFMVLVLHPLTEHGHG